MNEAEKRDQNAISRYSVTLMNNTKWREVFSVLYQKVGLPFEVAYVREEEEFRHASAPHISMLEDDYIKDPGLGGGPTYYKEIFSIRIPRKENYRNPKTGAASISEETSKDLLKALHELGQLPIELTDEYIIIYGYRK